MLRVWPRFASTVLLVVCGRVGAQEPESAATTPARTDPSQSPAALVREGNALFNEQAFEDALGKYDLAKQALPDSPELAFNRGLTQYRLGRLNEAGGALNQAVLSADREVEALSKFLLGNVQHTRGVQARQQDPQRAIEALQQATRYYFDALDLQPDNDDLRANVELAQKLIKLIQEQEQQQQNSSSKTSSRAKSRSRANKSSGRRTTKSRKSNSKRARKKSNKSRMRPKSSRASKSKNHKTSSNKPANKVNSRSRIGSNCSRPRANSKTRRSRPARCPQSRPNVCSSRFATRSTGVACRRPGASGARPNR